MKKEDQITLVCLIFFLLENIPNEGIQHNLQYTLLFKHVKLENPELMVAQFQQEFLRKGFVRSKKEYKFNNRAFFNGVWKIKFYIKYTFIKKDILFSLNAKHKQEGNEPTR